jgi:hypothetical protein
VRLREAYGSTPLGTLRPKESETLSKAAGLALRLFSTDIRKEGVLLFVVAVFKPENKNLLDF